jgi:hypothetical protein
MISFLAGAAAGRAKVTMGWEGTAGPRPEGPSPEAGEIVASPGGWDRKRWTTSSLPLASRFSGCEEIGWECPFGSWASDACSAVIAFRFPLGIAGDKHGVVSAERCFNLGIQ